MVSFADPIRQAALPILTPFYGGADAAWKAMTTDAKDRLVPGLCASPRHILRTLGDEWGRQIIHPQLWFEIARKRIEKGLAEGAVVVVDDVRYENEHGLIASYGGFLVRVERPDAPDTGDHASEGRLEGHKFDYDILNDAGLELLHAKADVIATAALGWFPY